MARNDAFFIKFGETKQIVVALIATTLKAALPVTKTKGRFTGRKYYAGYIHLFFGHMLGHIILHPYKKVRRP
jgi:hypothetical protein